ncbi:Glutamine--tRNA ligase [Buchnera aphidicola (Thelaxes suberi)]|uniref:glutamine--tRNA ligase n=1 Tax=Buchnera aphidicola TaxID=9 RepID=UPI0034641E50
MKKKIHGFIEKIIENDIKKNNQMILRTRFPPEPNGYLHIGHVKSIYLNFTLAEYYNGLCNLRYDDTNPKKEKKKFVNAIKKDILWMGFNIKNITFTSEYFDILYTYAVELIKKKLAYVDQLTKKEIHDYRGTLKQKGINSPYRNQNVQKNLDLFSKMKNGFFSEGTVCLRAKINMSSSSIIMRDPVLYRVIESKHYHTQNKWFIYPTYDFAHCISDAIEGITHSLCTLEFQENKKLYEWILTNISVSNYPRQYEYARLKLEFTILSKRKLQILIEKKIISGWDDPRIPTISGLRNKGYTPESLRDFVQKTGFSKQDSLIPLHLLESSIRKDLNMKSIRRMAVIDPLLIIIENIDLLHCENITVPNHPNVPTMGSRKIIFSREIYINRDDFKEYADDNYTRLTYNNEVRLRYAYTIKVTRIEKNKKNEIIKLFCIYDKNTFKTQPKNKKISGVIHWISKKNVIPTKFYFYSPLFTIKNPDLEKNFLNYISKKSKIKKNGFIEKDLPNNISCIPYQFERIGYFIIKKEKNKLTTCHQTVSLK